MKKLLSKECTKRLGHIGAAEVKSHPWFEKINWKNLQERKIKAPFVPELKSDIDTRNFDIQFTSGSVGSY